MPGFSLKKFNALSGISRHDLIAVEFLSDAIKAAHLQVFPNSSQLERVFYKETSGMTDIDIARALRSFINQISVRNAQVINVIPSGMVIFKNIEIPSVDRKEIKEIISLQASRHTPYSREEVIVDYSQIGVYKHSYSKILLVIIARHILKKQLEIMAKAGLIPQKVLLGAEGMGYFLPKLLKTEQEETVVCFTHMDVSTTEFIVTFQKKALFVRSVPFGAKDFRNEKEKSQLRFIDELRRSLEAYHSENIEKSVTLLVCSGSTGELKAMEASLNSSLHIPVKIIPYLASLNATAAALKEAESNNDVSFLDVASALYSYREAKIDLVPEELKLKRSLEQRGRDLIKTGIFIITIFVLIVFILITKTYFKGVYLNELDKKFKTLHEEASKLEQDYVEIGIVKNYLLNRGFSLEIIAQLYDNMPLEMRIEDVRYDASGKFSLRGCAESMSVVFSFADAMEKTEFFKDVQTKYTSKRKEANKDITDFEINCAFKRKTGK